MARRPPSLFSKILLNPSSTELQIPSSFATKYFNNEIPKDLITLSANGGYSWEIKVEKIDESYCFTHGWENVVQDTQFRFADMLLFRIVDQSSFKMSIYSSNGCERSLPPKSRVEPDVVVDDDDVVVLLDADDDDVDDGDDDEIVSLNDDDGDDDDDDDDEIVSLNDDDDDDHHHDDGDPFFISVISKGHNTMLRLPRDFVRLAKIEARRTITLKNPEGNEWQMGVGVDRGNPTERYYLSGWLDFRRSNELSEGDECVFKFIRSENKMCLAKVTKKTGPNQNPATWIPKKCQVCGGGPSGRPRKQRHGTPAPQ